MLKSIVKKKKIKSTDITLGQMIKQNYTDKITKRDIHIHNHKKRKVYIYIFI